MAYTIFCAAHFLAPDVDLGPLFGGRRKSVKQSQFLLTRADTLLDVMPILD